MCVFKAVDLVMCESVDGHQCLVIFNYTDGGMVRFYSPSPCLLLQLLSILLHSQEELSE